MGRAVISPETIGRPFADTSRVPAFSLRPAWTVAYVVFWAPILTGEETSEETVELSPFVVEASRDSGYLAYATLAGTRIRTELRDLGAAISVITPEFLRDTGANDAQTLLSYTLNTEVGGYQGNFSGATDVRNGRYYQVEERTNPQFNQRIRGLGSASLTRNLFLTDIPFDTYNTERVTINRGANSLLFGIGEPGGVIDNTTKSAVFAEDFLEAEFRVDNEGSFRAQSDVNISVVKNRLALRLATLFDDTRFDQEPTWNRDKRAYAALEGILLENRRSGLLGPTRISANGEIGSSRGSPVEVIPPSIAYHGWFEPLGASFLEFSGSVPDARALDPSEGGTWQFQPTYNPFEINAEVGIPNNTHPADFERLTLTYPNADATEPDVQSGGLDGYGAIIQWNPGIDTLASAGVAGSPAVAGRSPDDPLERYVEYHPNSPYAEPYAVGFAVPTLQNREVFDYRKEIFSGGLDRVERDFDVNSVRLEQTFLDHHLAFELAWDRQHYGWSRDLFFAGGAATSTTGPYDIYVAISEYLPNGQPNPHLGRPYTRVAAPRVESGETDREVYRATAFGELDFSGKNGWARFLGRHRFTGLFAHDTKDIHYQQVPHSWSSNEFDVGRVLQDENNGLASGPRFADIRVYVGDSLLGLNSTEAVRLDRVSITRPKAGESFNLLYADVSHHADAERALRTGAAIYTRFLRWEQYDRQIIDSRAFAWQSYFFEDTLVGLLGFRRDETASYTNASSAETGVPRWTPEGRFHPEFARLSAQPAWEESGDTVTWSVILRYPEQWLPELPAGMDLQVHYAASENFNPIGLRNDALGRPIPQPTGETREYGVTAGFWDHRVVFKVNLFETRVDNVSAGPNVNVAGEIRNRISFYVDGEEAGIPFQDQLETVQGDPTEFPIQSYAEYYAAFDALMPAALRERVNPRFVDPNGYGIATYEIDPIPNLASTQDRVAEGLELELAANPTTQWRFQVNLSRQETVHSNTAALMAEVVDAYTAQLTATRLGELRRDGVGSGQTRPISEFWLSQRVAPVRAARALDGTVSNEQREWRFSAVTNYTFDDGFLDGFALGGAVRWESRAATGYRLLKDPETGLAVPDVTKPWFDDGQYYGDLWCSYERRLFERIDWRIQLNFRNLIARDEDIPVKTNPDGQVAVIRIPNPLLIELTNTFRF